MPTDEGHDRAESGSPEPPVEADRPPTPGHLSDSAEADTPEEQAGRFQFSLRWMFGLTFAVAVLCSLAAWSGVGFGRFFGLLYLTAYLLAPLTIWAAMGLCPSSSRRHRKWVGLVVGTSLIVPMMASLATVADRGRPYQLFYFLFALLGPVCGWAIQYRIVIPYIRADWQATHDYWRAILAHKPSDDEPHDRA